MRRLVELNNQQREAVHATEGPVLVIAGAGSGKTRVLTERIAYLVGEKGVSPRHLLAFTFTNKAAQEMKERLERVVPGIGTVLWVGTFHATGVRVLRHHGERIGIPRRFSIYDADDSLDLIKEILSRLAVQSQFVRSPRNLRDTISRWKNALMTPELALEQASNNIEKRVVDVYAEYERSLRRARALDFDDLIAKVVELFTLEPEVKDLYAKKFNYILVDEFQDTNPIQMALIDALASHHHNLFIVGDDDQSIYSWRGAKVDHILNFENLYSDTRVIRLEQNYRSTQTILDAANHVIAHNRGRKGKNLWTEGEAGKKIQLLVSMDEESEAMNVLHTVTSLLQEGVRLGDIAILYRTNAQSRALEQVLKLGSLPYQIIGSVRYYERKEVRDILAYCKLIANPADNISLKRILNVPKRALGKTTFDRLSGISAERNVPIMEVLRSGDHELGSAQRKRCAEFVRLYSKLEDLARREEAPRVVEAVINDIDFKGYLRDSYPDAESRIENAEELVAAAEAFIERSEDRSLAAFLEEIALVADVDALDEARGQLTLMTLHNAKGLEFECIIITGAEEGLFPHYNSSDNPESLEEERRLFYVGMTRAKSRLFLSYANMRRRMGIIKGGTPSRFLLEIPDELLEGAVDTLHSGDVGGVQTEFEDYSQEEVMYSVGMRIVHDNFGRGIVRKVEGTGESLRVTVIFDGGGERKFLAHFAPMKPRGSEAKAGSQRGIAEVTLQPLPRRAAMRIDRKTIAHLEKLARIELTPDEAGRLTAQLDEILEYVRTLQEVDTDDIDPTHFVLHAARLVLRPDIAAPALERDEILGLAPDAGDGFYRVPRIIERGDEE
jgi:DNA helicase-2/ATP-dependent DNA helicase PcrA